MYNVISALAPIRLVHATRSYEKHKLVPQFYYSYLARELKYEIDLIAIREGSQNWTELNFQIHANANLHKNTSFTQCVLL